MSTLKAWLPLIVTVVGSIGAAIFTPAFVGAHPALFASLNSAAMLLHAILPSVFGAPTAN
jgi:hypothetical protein